jgi:hypothetical protein
VRQASFATILIAGLIVAGCSSTDAPRPSASDCALFGPAAMRIHPIFTRIKDFNGDNIPDGIDALLEFQDQFGDATKASGTVIFELYEFQKFDAERRGPRVCNPWVGSLQTVEDQRQRWNRTSRTYSFPLAYSLIIPTSNYVLTAEFQLSGGGRFYDQIVLEAPQGAYAPKGAPIPAPATQATTQTTQPAPSSQPSARPSSAPAIQPTSQP